MSKKAALIREHDELVHLQNKAKAPTDAVRFANLLKVQNQLTKRDEMMRPDAWQVRVLRSKNRRILLNVCRQAGKSTVASVAALHTAIYIPRSLVLIIAPSARQSGETFLKVRQMLQSISPRPDLDTDSRTEIQFENGSRVVSLPADEAKIRGFSAATLIIEDEAGDVPDELHEAILPMLTISRGRLLLQGTPKGRRGHFFEAWDKGGDGWERYEVSWRDCPRMDPGEIELQRIGLREKFPQEFENQFIRLAGGMVYSAFEEARNVIDALPESDKWQYLLGIDFGFVDATAFVLVGWLPNDPKLYVIKSFQETGLHADDIAKRIKDIAKVHRFGRIIGDIGGYGKGPAEELRSRYQLNIEGAPKTEKAGYIDLLNAGFATGNVLVYKPSNMALIQQVVELPWNESRTNDLPGYDNHLCDGLLYAHRVGSQYLQKPLPPKPETPEAIIQSETREYWERVEQENRRIAEGGFWGEGDNPDAGDPMAPMMTYED